MKKIRRFFSYVRNQSQKDGITTVKLKHVLFTFTYFVSPGTLSVEQTLQPRYALKKTGFLRSSKISTYSDISQNFSRTCVLLQSSLYSVLALVFPRAHDKG